VGHPLPQVLQRRSEEARPVAFAGNGHPDRSSACSHSSALSSRPEHRVFCDAQWRDLQFGAPCHSLLYLRSCNGFPNRSVALWCNWLTRRPLKAKSSSSSLDNATIFNDLRRPWRSPLSFGAQKGSLVPGILSACAFLCSFFPGKTIVRLPCYRRETLSGSAACTKCRRYPPLQRPSRRFARCAARKERAALTDASAAGDGRL
jgi:hypothetical protein